MALTLKLYSIKLVSYKGTEVELKGYYTSVYAALAENIALSRHGLEITSITLISEINDNPHTI